MPKVLYFEDEPDIAELVRRWLEEDNEHQVLHARDGASGFRLAVDELPDLILLDIYLGEFSLDGWAVNRLLKEEPATSAIPVIVISGHAWTPEHRARALREGFVDHLAKPFAYDQLMARVKAHVRVRRGP
jgi:DNA-binding response OmpR family regulator